MKITSGYESMLRGMEEWGSSSSKTDKSGQSFASFLKGSVNDVNQLLTEADKQTQDLVLGRSENLHESMIATEKAETALKLLTQVRNKAIEAYNQIIQMQV